MSYEFTNKNESNILSNVSKKIDEYLSKNNITPYEMGKNTGVSQVTIGRYRKGESTPTAKNLEKILNIYPDLLEENGNYPINIRFLKVYEYLKSVYPNFTPQNINITDEELLNIQEGKIKAPLLKILDINKLYPEINANFITVGQDEMLINPIDYESITNTIIPESNLKEKEYPEKLSIRLVPIKAQAGWCEGYYNDEYLQDMPFVIIDAEEKHRGNYIAFEVSGDSMEPDYIAGDVVICREVQRHLWQSKLHINQWDFVIAHPNGIMLKEIIKHDVEKGIIYCHSINPKYEDFKIYLQEVRFLFNVVEVRQKGRSKRSNRAKDFL